MEADFQQYYHLDLIDVYRGKISLRKAQILASQLPRGARVWREFGGRMAWTEETDYLTRIEYQLQAANWQRSKDGSNASKRPEPIAPPEPAHERTRKENTIASAARRFKERMRARSGGTTQ